MEGSPSITKIVSTYAMRPVRFRFINFANFGRILEDLVNLFLARYSGHIFYIYQRIIYLIHYNNRTLYSVHSEYYCTVLYLCTALYCSIFSSVHPPLRVE